jgi:hypothetical protein
MAEIRVSCLRFTTAFAVKGKWCHKAAARFDHASPFCLFAGGGVSGGNKSEIRTIGVQFALFAWEHQPDVRSHARGQDIDSGAARVVPGESQIK